MIIVKMKTKDILVIAGIFIVMGAAAGYFPPTHIAQPEMGNCTYYFAGDERHHNPLPNGTWYMVGLAEENRSTCQEACTYYTIYEPQDKIWKGLLCDCLGEGEEGCTNWCRIKEGEWVKDEKGCVCPMGMEWSPDVGCVKSPDYGGAITECSDEIRDVITKLNSIGKKLGQSGRSRESLNEQIEELKEEFLNLKNSTDDAEALEASIQKIEWMFSDLDMRLTDSDPTGGALGEVEGLRDTLSGYEGGEETTTVPGTETTVSGTETAVPQAAGNDSTLWIGLILVVVVTLAGIYYVSRG